MKKVIVGIIIAAALIGGGYTVKIGRASCRERV